MKRVFDFIFSLILLSLLWPVILVVMFLVRCHGNPVFFCQQRLGLYGKPFYIYKIRTMLLLYDSKGELLPDKERMTVLGAFLRKCSLDEMPQLLNVIKGDLSLVGPRPLLMEYLPLYTQEQARRHNARPGITGWAQVNGRNTVSWEDKFKQDVWYVDNQSFWLDIKILFKTLKQVFLREGISTEGEVTMPRFTGTPKKDKI